MKEKQKKSTGLSSLFTLIFVTSENYNKDTLRMVAGVTGYVFAAMKEFLSICGTYIGGVVSPAASLDPTPGLVYPSMQAKGNRISPCFNQIPCLTPATSNKEFSSLI
jgi:hypothetical protein